MELNPTVHVRYQWTKLHISISIIQFQYRAISVNFNMHIRPFILISIFLPTILSAKTYWNVLRSTEKDLSIEVTIDLEDNDLIEPITLLIGIPTKELPSVSVRSFNPRKTMIKNENPKGGVTWINQQIVRKLKTATLEIDPTADDEHYYGSMIIDVSFGKSNEQMVRSNSRQEKFLKHRIVNWNVAQNWFKKRHIKRHKRQSIPEGTWIKFAVKEDKVYSITGSEILSLSLTMDENDPRSFRLFTGSALGRDRSVFVINSVTYDSLEENLVEIPFLFEGEEDGILDPTDKIIFYGRGASGFDLDVDEVTFDQNIYFTENTYWMLIPDDQTTHGPRITDRTGPSTVNLNLDYGNAYVRVENDVINPFEGGLVWTGPSFGRGASYTAIIQSDDVETSVDGEFEIAVRGSSSDFEYAPSPSHTIEMYLNSRDELRAELSFNGLSKQTASFTVDGSELTDGTNFVYLDNNSTSSYSTPHFDHATLKYGRLLNSDNTPFEFHSPIHSNDVSFSFSGSNSISVWDITQIERPIDLSIDTDLSFSIQLPTDTLARFVVFDDDDPEQITDLSLEPDHRFFTLRDQLDGVEHVIIGPEEFRSNAQPLVNHRGSSQYVALEDIYNEFSGGNADPTAIRSFAQWTLENWSNPPYCLLILGDTDYDYRNITGQSESKVPTIITGSYSNKAVDDRLVAVNGRIPDLAIGRFPAQSTGEVDDFVEKLIEYETNPIMGYWRQRVTLVADDAARPEDGGSGGSISTGKSHTNNSENVADWISPRVEVNKLYMLEFPEVSDASSFGVVKPDATDALMETISEGTAIINYIGHGSEHQWAQEKLLVQDRGDIDIIDTDMKLPIWIAGTCSWGHFDFLDVESFSEELIREPMDGAAAIITTSRAIGVSSNATYIEKIFKALFPDHEVSDDPIGVILQSVKDGNSSGELFHLFGDPAMPLPIPNMTVDMTHIDPDTLSSLDTARIYGEHELSDGLDGSGVVRLVDAEKQITREYIINSTDQEISYTLPGPTLFKGQFSINGNNFNAKMRIPKDISYSTTPAYSNVYVQMDSDPPKEALGILNDIIIQSGDPVNDDSGPIISFETGSGQELRDKDHILSDQSIYVRLSDPLGINITGEVGHEIMVTDLEDDSKDDISNRFIYDENSITTGVVSLPFDYNSESISLKVKAWDNANNPSEKEVTFYLLTDQSLQVMNIYNFPNPYTTTTQFAFELTSSANVSIDVFTLGGRRVVSIPEVSLSGGYHYIDWNGRDEYGDRLANGVYLYRLKADDGTQNVSVIRKLAKFQ